MRLLDGYLWGYKNVEAGDNVFRKFKEFYPNGSTFIIVDKGGDETGYQNIADKYESTIRINEFNIGYPGNHGEHNIGRPCWPKENAFLWCDNLLWACEQSDAKFIIVFEEDSFILKPISIINDNDFGISVLEYNTNHIPPVLLDVVEQIGGNTNIPTNKFGRKGYGAAGGFIIDRKKYIESWKKFRPILELNYDEIVKESKLIGWSDCLAQLILMAGGYTVVPNPQYIQTWYSERPDLYPNFTKWEDYEIVDYIKDIDVIKNL